jgi:hypothetical protein
MGPNELIEGFKIDVPGAEMRAHLNKRAVYHREKADAYTLQADGVAALKPASGQSNDPVANLQQSASQHHQKYALFSFMAEHVVPDTTYRMSERDLVYTEIVMDRW